MRTGKSQVPDSKTVPELLSRSMDKVNLFLIGVNKAGTSWLHYLLAEHPDIFMATAKELYYFGDENKGPNTLDAYHSHFPFEEPYRYFGEATVMYYRSADVAEAIRTYNPEAKLLAIVRDPIDRLVSQYTYRKQLGLLDESTSLREALDGRDPRLVRDSHYEETLPAFEERFGSDQFKVVSLEEGRADPEAFWTELLDYLDLPPMPVPPSRDRPENPTGSPAFRWVYRTTVRPIRHHVPRLYEWMLESALIRQIKLGLLRLLGTAESTPIPEDLRARLQEEFAPTYAYLQRRGFDVYDSPSSPST